eukprot:TRINITY_DN38578_c0_g1_i1.p1 TRINITY_DN38578_c0_g1~~TRINITY_DN38578_c0_g1_i1.p1  ORF type:complete len:340 (+),score=97.15 TRINITY_DN38578_c0_g1_i1:79-1098(+)
MAPKESKPEKPKKSAMQRAMELIPALNESDDERTAVSKKVSWILRHGARKVNCKMNEEGWVLVSDLLKVEIMDNISKATLMKIVNDSNLQKLRYAIEGDGDDQKMKAIMKDKKRDKADAAPKVTDAAASAATADGAGSAGLRATAPAFVPNEPSAPAAQAAPAAAPGTYPMLPYANYFGYGYPGMGYPFPFPAMPPAAMVAAAQSAQKAQAPQAPGYFRGKIKFFDEKKGFGFLECKEAHAMYNRDVFLHKADMGELEVGNEVQFTVEMSKKGMPQARTVTLLKAGQAPSSPEKGAGKGKKGDKKGKGKGGKDKGGKGDAEGKKKPVEPGAIAASTEKA